MHEICQTFEVVVEMRWNLVVYQVRYAKSKYGHKIRQWLSANKLCMRFVKPMKEWLKWD